MKTVLAAIDASAAARPVMQSAISLAAMTGAEVDAVHVAADGTDAPSWVASHHGVALRVLAGPVEGALLQAMDDEAVVAAVFGARRSPWGRRPVGGTALHVLRLATKPVVVVPPEADGAGARPYLRLLVPLEGDAASSRPVLERLGPLLANPVELVVLHVFSAATLPRALDRPARDLSLWSDEFVARHCPGATRIDLRTGPVGASVSAVAAEEAADLVVLSWSQDSSPGHAAVVREVLGRSTVPVMLLPVDGAAGRADPVIDLRPRYADR